MYYSDNIDELFISWRKSSPELSYDAILQFAHQHSMKLEETKDTANDVVSNLFRQSRMDDVGVPEAAASNARAIHNISAMAMNDHPLLNSPMDLSETYSVKVALKGIANKVGQFLSSSFTNAGYATAAALLAVAGVSYLNIYGPDRSLEQSIASIEIPGIYSMQDALLSETDVLGFSNDTPLKQNQFNLGGVLAKVRQIDDGMDAASVDLMLKPYQLSISKIGNQSTSLSQTLVQGKEVEGLVSAYLEEPAIYIGYWVQNIYFSLDQNSGEHIQLLMHHHQLLPKLEKVLDEKQYAKLSAIIQEYREQPDSIDTKQIRMLSNTLSIWLG